MDDMLIKFKNIVDEEIQAYEVLNTLSVAKQEILVQRRSDELFNVDSELLRHTSEVKELILKRKEIAKYFGNENLTMSEIIEIAKKEDENFAEILLEQKHKINKLSENFAQITKTNLSLAKHGLVMVGKSIDIIMSAIAPEVKKGQYNSQGQTVESDKSMISSIIEEV